MRRSRSFARLAGRAFALGLAAMPVLVPVVLMPQPAVAQGLFGTGSPVVRAELLPGWRTERGTHLAALHLELAEGWKTYWRIPGEAGIAPQFDWSGSQNLASVVAHWPRPVVFDQNGFRSIGYHDELVLPLEFMPRDPARPMALSAQVTIGACRETCVPVDLTLNVALRGEGARDGRIQAALERQAEPAAAAGLSRAVCGLEPAERGARLTLRASLPRVGAREHLVMELPGTDYWVSDSVTRREGDELVASARVRSPRRDVPVSLDRSAMTFTLISDERMLVHRGCTGG